MKLLFLHGWGFEASLWDEIRAALAPFETIVWDRGYFGAAAQEKVEGPLIAVGHSLGSLLLASDPPPGCVRFIAINGFDRFADAGLVEPQVLDRMQLRFASSPRGVLEDFHRRVGVPGRYCHIDIGRLGADLRQLRTLDARGQLVPDLVLHGGRDEILPPFMRESVFAGAKRLTLAEGGHLLPLTHPLWCADRIRELLA